MEAGEQKKKQARGRKQAKSHVERLANPSRAVPKEKLATATAAAAAAARAKDKTTGKRTTGVRIAGRRMRDGEEPEGKLGEKTRDTKEGGIRQDLLNVWKMACERARGMEELDEDTRDDDLGI